MDKANRKALTNDELENVSGGYHVESVSYLTRDVVAYKWNVGDHVEKITSMHFFHVFTVGATILERKADMRTDGSGFCAWYLISCSESEYNNKWFEEEDFEHGYISIRQVN